MKMMLSLWVVFASTMFVAHGQTQPFLKFEDGLVRVIGSAFSTTAPTAFISCDQWHSILSVYTHEAYLRDIDQPIAGKHGWSADTIYFQPSYAFAPGETYHAVFTPNAFFKNAGIKNESEKFERRFTFPRIFTHLQLLNQFIPSQRLFLKIYYECTFIFLLR